ncbi:nucleoporin protein Ndc1-Nup [Infundibulicybe gibba]|nr:nucleoporin protein Ndc1-Nup [Infundibulicybe gibba]
MAATPTAKIPVKAITSTLSARSSPSIPPASQSYEPLVKAVLQHRLKLIFSYSLGCSWLITFAWVAWNRGGLSRLGVAGMMLEPFRPFTIMLAAPLWATSALPIIILRKVYLSGTRITSTSPSHTLRTALSKPNNIPLLAIYTASAILSIFLCFHDDRIGLFVKSRKHPYYLNGRVLFLGLSQVTVASCFLLRNIIMDRFTFRWSLVSSAHAFGLSHIVRVLATGVVLASMTLPLALGLFAAARICLPLLYKLPLLHRLLRPFTAHFLRGPSTVLLPLYHLPLLLRSWFLALATLLGWESADTIFDVFVTQPISISHTTADPGVTLVSGISSEDAIFKYTAYCELRDFAANESAAASTRRTALFSDQKYTPNLWSRLLRTSLIQLGHDYQLLLRRGKPVAPAAPSAPQAPVVPQFPATPTPLIKSSIYRTTPASPVRTVVDSLASDGSFTQTLEAGANAARIPEIFRAVESAVSPPKQAKAEPAQNTKPVDAKTISERAGSYIYGLVDVYLPPAVRQPVVRTAEWWRKERISKVAAACLPNREMDVAIIGVLSQLTCASLTEDRYGVLQRDIPKILEAMLSFLTVIEEYQREINALYAVPPPESRLTVDELRADLELRTEVEKAGEVLSLVGDELKDGVGRIVRTFGDKLLAFTFPPRTASKLQGFLDYC